MFIPQPWLLRCALCLGCAVLLAACGPTSRPNTLARAWQDAPLLAVDNEWGAFDYHEVTDAQGQQFAVWEQFDGLRYNIWANRKMRGEGWGVAQMVETDNAGSAFNPRVAMDSQGNAAVVWQQHDGTRWRIAANRYMQGTGWSQAQWIDAPQAQEANAPQVDFDSQGNVVVVWQHKDATGNRIMANRMTAGAGWGVAVALDKTKDYVSAPHLSRDAQGQLVGLWQVQGKQGPGVQASRYLTGAGWGQVQWVQALDVHTDYPPKISHIVLK